jgi:thioredoxin reductase (NADPH)
MTIDVLIAGGGLTGLTAAVTAARLGRSTMVLTGEMLGGQLTSINVIEGYPGFPAGVAGYDLCPAAQEQAEQAGAAFAADSLARLERQGGLWLAHTTDGQSLAASSVILAMGARPKRLDVPGAGDFHIGHCASCDGPLWKGQDVAVIGGGDSALQEALTLAEAGARVHLVHRGAKPRAQASFLRRVQADDGIICYPGSELAEILGESSVAGVRLQDGTHILAAAVFAYIGLQPNSQPVEGLVDLDPNGFVETDANLRTGQPGIFAAGAVRSGWGGRAVLAAGEGAAAAIAVGMAWVG